MAYNNCDFTPCQNAIICGIVCTCHLGSRTEARDTVGLFLELSGEPGSTHYAIQLVFVTYNNCDFMPCRNAIICGIVCTCHLHGRTEARDAVGLFLNLPGKHLSTHYAIQLVFMASNNCDFMPCQNAIIC